MYKKTTDELLKIISQENRLETFIHYNSNEFENTTLTEELNRLLVLHKFSKAQVVQHSLMDKTYTYQIFDGTKKIHPKISF